MLGQVTEWESAAVQAVEAVRFQPLTTFFLLASAWWVKWPLFAVVGVLGDCCHRRRVPTAFLTALAATAVAGVTVTVLKLLAGRPRPPLADPAVTAVGTLPDSASFPSGHSATAFAAACAVGLVCPRLRIPLVALAATVALSRVYLGVHYWTDVVAGSLLGSAIGLLAGWLVLRARRSPRRSAPSPAPL